MQRNYPRMFSPADDQDKDGFKLNGNIKAGIQNPETGIQRNPQDSAIGLYKNCLKIMSTQMLYFSIRDTRGKKSNLVIISGK